MVVLREEAEAQTNPPADGKSLLLHAAPCCGFCRCKAHIQKLNLVCVYGTIYKKLKCVMFGQMVENSSKSYELAFSPQAPDTR